MVADNHLTPEKQLLNLIENPQNKGAVRKQALLHRGASLFSLNALRGRFAFFRKNFRHTKSPFSIGIRQINAGLFIAIAVLAVYLIASTLFSFSEMDRKMKMWNKVVPVDPASAQQAVSSLQELTYYLSKTQERDIFQIGPRRKVVKAAEIGGPSVDLMEATKDLRLVGISWSDNPDIMIEDVNRKMTFFLKRGQELEGGVLIKDVFRDKVIMEYKGEELELQ